VAGPKLRASRARALLAVLSALSFLARRLSLKRAQRMGSVLGTIANIVARGERRKAMANMSIAFPDWTVSQRLTITRAMFRHLGTTLFEILWLTKRDENVRAASTRFENIEPVLALIRSGKSIVAFTGHCGNWEWLAYSCAKLGIPISVMQRERSEPGLNEFIVNIRKGAGLETIDRGSTAAGREMIRAMRKPGAIAFLIDQSIRAESAKVPFFGRPALTPIGPATLAIRTGAYAVAIFIERRDGVHVIRCGPPIPTKRDDDPITLTAAMTLEIEKHIRDVPEQWVWMHDRWRDRPKWDVTVTL
jgi:KDO2-lipid IV(A) lauroyltransferase